MLQGKAHAKINLYLHITGKRANGYHELDSWVNFLALHDVLTVVPAENFSLSIHGNAALESGDDNLILRAAKTLQQATQVSQGAAFTLHKHIPLGAGLGGGSADAATALRLLCALWNVAVPERELSTLALSLGADVPLCLKGSAAVMRGVGEQLSLAPSLTGVGILLVYPHIPLATAQVYSAYNPPFSAPVALPATFADSMQACRWLADTRNDLQAPAIACLPQLQGILDSIAMQPGCLLARMSGSGSACFGVFTDYNALESAAMQLRQTKPEWWIEKTELI